MAYDYSINPMSPLWPATPKRSGAIMGNALVAADFQGYVP